MGRSKSSHRWLQEHHGDPYVREARQAGLRSRAALKLIEINEKDRLLRPGMRVLDLGAAPGGWTQVVSQQLDGRGEIFACDILNMDALPDVCFMQGDFTEQETLDELRDALGERPLDLVLSDMAPNMSGNRAVDQPGAMYLAELALDLALAVLRPDGDFLVKVFQGEGIDTYRKQLQQSFGQVKTRKPGASRDRSREHYLLCRGLKG